jgi:hypothetical protein
VPKVEVFLVGAAWRNFTMVKIETDSGIVGWGEGTLGWKETAVRELIEDFARRYLIGQNPADIESFWFKLYQIEHNTGPVMYSAMAGFETGGHRALRFAVIGKPSPRRIENTCRRSGTDGGCEGRRRLAPVRQLECSDCRDTHTNYATIQQSLTQERMQKTPSRRLAVSLVDCGNSWLKVQAVPLDLPLP